MDSLTDFSNRLKRPVLIEGDPDPRFDLSKRMAHYRVPGVGVAIADADGVLHAEGFGKAGNGRSVTTDTLFQAGSISKPVTAVAALRLVEKGLLDLDEDIGNKLQGWRLPEHPGRQSVTLRRILSHNAGLSVTGFPGYRSEARLPTTIEILGGRSPANTAPVEVAAEPGSRVSYSGGGFTVVQLLIEELTGLPFADALQELVLEPAGMEHSSFEQRLPTELADLASLGHQADGRLVEGGHHLYPEQAAAGLWSTPADLTRFASALRASWLGTGTLLREETARTMFIHQAGIYGLGIRLERHEHGSWFWHTGGAEGFRTQLRGDLKTGRAVVVMANGEDGMQLIREVLEGIYEPLGRLASERRVARLARVDGSRYAGEYHYRFEAFDRSLSIRSAGSELLASAPTLWAGERTWLPESETKFFAPDGDTPIEMTLDEGGQLTGLSWGSHWYRKVG